MRYVLSIFAVATIALAAGGGRSATAQSPVQPQLMITWRSNSAAPSFYRGKVLPSPGARITASFDLIDGGNVQDLSGRTIYWYLDNELIEDARNSRTVEFAAPFTVTQRNIDLRVQLPNYKPNMLVLKTITIPVVAPVAVIESPYPRGELPAPPLTLTAHPFFFTVPQGLLSFSWNVNGRLIAEGPGAATAEIGAGADLVPGGLVSLELRVSNPRNPFEAGTDKLLLTAQQ